MIVSAFAAGCSEGPTTQPDDSGPLSATTGQGGFTASAPRNASEWSETFGAFLLCSKEPDTEIQVEDVRFDVSPEPQSIETWFRKIPPAKNQNGGPAWTWDPIISERGTPPFRKRYGGDFVKELDEPITQDCRELRKQGSPVTELLTTMTVGERGAVIRRTYVDYTVDDEEYTLTIRWQNGMCGSAIKGRGCNR